MIAALFVQPGGVYSGRPDVDPWPESRDARRYAGPWAVVAHPPCASWGNYAKPTPESTARGPLLGDDGGCFAAAIDFVRRYGGVLEHPANSRAWPCGGVLGRSGLALHPPALGGGWTASMLRPGEWSCEVDQGHYGHVARKPTWLFYVGAEPPPLRWGQSNPPPIGTGARRGNLESLSKVQRAATPRAFADLLVDLAHLARPDHLCRVFDPDSDCPECQIIWAGMVDEMSSTGRSVRVTLPPDIAPWHDEAAYGKTWVGDVVGVNGDSLDITTPDGDIEPVDINLCRPWKPGRFTTWKDE